jgi:flagellar hook protein FlgE
VALNFGTANGADGVTQFDSPSTLISSRVNGALFGGLSGVRISEDGFLTALFDNGVQRQVYKLPLATFPNANGLAAITGNAFIRTDLSGNYSLLEAETGGAGSIASASLEASTVDLGKEFTDLITTQRAYSAATRIITTADQMLEELVRIKR